MAKNKNLTRIDLKNVPIATKRTLHRLSKEDNLSQTETFSRAVSFYNKWIHGAIDFNDAHTQAIKQLILTVQQLAVDQKSGFGTIKDSLKGLLQVAQGPNYYSKYH